MPDPRITDDDQKQADSDMRVKDPARVEPELTSDSFSEEEKKKIVEAVLADYDVGIIAQADWQQQKTLDFKCYDGAKPSELENLTKKGWQSDRNLGLFASVADTFQAVLKATCYNPDAMSAVATEANDVDTSKNWEKFNKWLSTSDEDNFEPQVDDFIHNRVIYGTSYFKVRWKVWYEWVDSRIPKLDKGSKRITGYEIKTEYKRFEKGVIENIADIDDVLLPSYGDDLQDLPFVIIVNHMRGGDVLQAIEEKVFTVKDKETYKKSLESAIYEDRKGISEEKKKSMGFTDAVTDTNIDSYPVEVLECYRKWTKGNKTEEYRFYVDRKTSMFLSGKPLRKVTRTGKRPIFGSGLIRVPGQVRGKSMMKLIFNVVSMIHNAFNQKSDFQYVNNCPFGFFKAEEGHTQQEYELIPMTMYPMEGNPNESIFFPNIQRSLAWAESDFRILFEILERVTGAATYFATAQNQSKTLGQDLLIDRSSQTRFGLWVRRIQLDIAAAMTMRMQMYQDWCPPMLGERVLGKEGKKLFPNLSVDTLRGNYEVKLRPDFVAGSREYKKQVRMWGFANLQNTLWMNPQFNPKGNYNFVADSMREIMDMSDTEIKRYMGPEPETDENWEPDLENEWSRFMQGDVFDPPEGASKVAFYHLQGHLKQRDKLNELDKEYHVNFDAHLFKTAMNVQKFIKDMQQEQMANQLANQMINQMDAKPGLPGGPPAAPGQPGAMPPQGGMAPTGAPPMGGGPMMPPAAPMRPPMQPPNMGVGQ